MNNFYLLTQNGVISDFSINYNATSKFSKKPCIFQFWITTVEILEECFINPKWSQRKKAFTVRKSFIENFFSKCDQIRRKLHICRFGHIYRRNPQLKTSFFVQRVFKKFNLQCTLQLVDIQSVKKNLYKLTY